MIGAAPERRAHERGRFRHVHRHGRARIATLEWRGAGEHLEGHAGEAVDVGRRLQRPLPTRLFRTHVLRRPDGETRAGNGGLVVLRGEDEGDPEIGEHRMAIGEKHVLGLYIPVHEAVLVRELQRTTHLARHAERVAEGQRALAVQTAHSDPPGMNGDT